MCVCVCVCIYIRLNAAYGTPVMHIAPRTGDRCFKETGAGLFNVWMCDCITNTFYLMIILVIGDSSKHKGINLCNYYKLYFIF